MRDIKCQLILKRLDTGKFSWVVLVNGKTWAKGTERLSRFVDRILAIESSLCCAFGEQQNFKLDGASMADSVRKAL